MKVTGRTALVITLLLVGCSGGNGPTATPSPVAATPTPTPSAAAAAPTPTLVTPTASVATVTPLASAPATAERTTAHIDVDGLTRDYAVVAPSDAADREPLPLLLFMVGGNVTPANEKAMEDMAGFDALAVEPGLIMVYPDGYQNSWNAGACCEPATTAGVDDVAFIDALVSRIEADYPVDPNRVFIGGDGTGGSMAYRAACERSERFAAVAVVSGPLLVDCSPANPIPALHIHGTEDVKYPYEGGGAECDGPCPSVDQTMERWRQADGCTGEPTATTEDTVVTTTYSTCEGGVEVEFIKVIGADDTWLGSEPGDRAVIWAFLMSHPPTPNAVTEHIDVGGMTRGYMVVTPPNVAEREPLPLLLALHGRTGTMYDAESIGGFDAMAVDPGAVVVYPQGYDGSWNAGTCCEAAARENIDDVAFIAALIDQMEATYPVDPNRVFVVGGSNGGEMAERAACELSGRIAAIADAMGTLLVDWRSETPGVSHRDPRHG